MNFRVDGLGVDSVWISMLAMWSRWEAGSRLGRAALLAAEAGHQDGGAFGLTVEAGEVDRLARRMRAFAEGAEADQAVGELGDPADIAGAALQRIECPHRLKPQVAVDQVQPLEQRLIALGRCHRRVGVPGGDELRAGAGAGLLDLRPP